MLRKKMSGQNMFDGSLLNRKKFFVLFSYIMIFLLSYVFIHASRWSYYCGDDFSHANVVGVFGKNIFELFGASIAFMVDKYRTWQGTFFSMFLQGFLSPINGAGPIQMSIVMISNVVLFICATIMLVQEISRLIGMEKHLKVFLSFLVLFSIFGFKAWAEIFYWFSGAVSYSIPLSVGMLALALFLKDKNIFTYILACVLAFLASGGSLEVAGTSCFAALTILFVKGYENLHKKDLFFFGIAVVGALVNAVAPGNFIRRDAIDDTGLHFGAAFINSVNQVIRSVEWLFYQTPFLVIAVLCVIVGVHIGGKGWFYKTLYLKIVGMCLALPVVTCFPVYLAYTSTNGTGFPNRCEFVCVCVIVIVIMVISVLLGVFLKETECMKEYKNLLGMLVAVCLIIPMLNDNYKYSNTVIYRMYCNVAVDGFKKYHDNITEIYRTIENSDNQDVVIEALPAAVPDFLDISYSLTTNPGHFSNRALAIYYGKNSVVLKPQE